MLRRIALVLIIVLGIFLAGCTETQIKKIGENVIRDTITINGKTYEIEKGTDIIFIRAGKPYFYKFEGNYMVFDRHGSYWTIPDKEEGMVIMADGQMSEISKNDIVYFANGEMQFADWVSDIIILVKGDYHFFDADFDEIIFFKNRQPAFVEFPEKNGICVIFKENGNYRGGSIVDQGKSVVIQNGKYYKLDSKIKEVILENGKRYTLS